jgi:hypothetical protein
LVDDNEKISITNYDNNKNNNGVNNFFANETVNVQQSPELIELVKKTEENIFNLIVTQQKLLASQQEQQIQITKLLESYLKITEVLNKKK